MILWYRTERNLYIAFPVCFCAFPCDFLTPQWIYGLFVDFVKNFWTFCSRTDIMVGAVCRTMEGCEHMVKFHTESLLSRLFLLLSGVACTVLLIMTESKLSFAVTGLLAVLLLSIFIFRTGFLSRLFVETHWGICLTAGILALAEVYRAKSTFYTTCSSDFYTCRED